MPRYVVEGTARGRLYAGTSLESALMTLQREVYQCRVEHHGPTDARLYCDGVLVETGLASDGTMGLAKARPRVEYPPIERHKKRWQR